MAKNVPCGPLLSPHRVYQQGGQNQLYVIWPQTCIFKFENIALEPFFGPGDFLENRSQQGAKKGESISVGLLVTTADSTEGYKLSVRGGAEPRVKTMV